MMSTYRNFVRSVHLFLDPVCSWSQKHMHELIDCIREVFFFLAFIHISLSFTASFSSGCPFSYLVCCVCVKYRFFSSAYIAQFGNNRLVCDCIAFFAFPRLLVRFFYSIWCVPLLDILVDSAHYSGTRTHTQGNSGLYVMTKGIRKINRTFTPWSNVQYSSHALFGIVCGQEGREVSDIESQLILLYRVLFTAYFPPK